MPNALSHPSSHYLHESRLAITHCRDCGKLRLVCTDVDKCARCSFVTQQYLEHLRWTSKPRRDRSPGPGPRSWNEPRLSLSHERCAELLHIVTSSLADDLTGFPINLQQEISA